MFFLCELACTRSQWLHLFLVCIEVQLRKVLANAEKMTANPELFGGDLFLRKLAPWMQPEKWKTDRISMNFHSDLIGFAWICGFLHCQRLGNTWTKRNWRHLPYSSIQLAVYDVYGFQVQRLIFTRLRSQMDQLLGRKAANKIGWEKLEEIKVRIASDWHGLLL